MRLRSLRKNYRWSGIYHITITVEDRSQQPLGHIVGDAAQPDGHPQAPRVLLSEIGRMVERELLESIHAHYPMIEIQDYVIMPDHLHFIVVVHRDIVSSTGRPTHLGQVIAGFKKGCNRLYWALTGQAAPPLTPLSPLSRPALLPPQVSAPGEPPPTGRPALLPPYSCPAVYPQGSAPGEPPPTGRPPLSGAPAAAPRSPGTRPPSDGSTGRPPLFSYGYVDVMPLKEGQLERQRTYIRNNPRYRLLRQSNPQWLSAQRSSAPTALTLPALRGYLERECGPRLFDADRWEHLKSRLIVSRRMVTCDSYGNRQLLDVRLLPVVCHRRDARLFEAQKAHCLAAAASGAVLVSARIAQGEQDIIDSTIAQGYAVVTVEDNGFPDIYYPSERRMTLCASGRLLIVSPWHYAYRHANEAISVAECKTMNCIVQTLCRTKDSWWKM